MPDFDLTGELSLKIELHMLRPITEKVHSGNGPASLVDTWFILVFVFSTGSAKFRPGFSNNNVHVAWTLL